jgi:hypothetical protein
MSTVACLRIAVGSDLAHADSDALAGLVAKVAGAYLETTWLWPRRFGLVAPFSFVLADPRATRLDARELQTLAANLQAKLFGAKGLGEVCLLMLEGDQTEVMRFAGAHIEDLKALLDGVDDGAFAGRICKITPDGVVSVAPLNGPVDGAPTAEELKAMPMLAEPPLGAGWRGVYRLATESFIGAALLAQTNSRGDPVGEGDDPFALDRDLSALRVVVKAAPGVATGLLFAGFSFSSLVRASVRAAVKPSLEALPMDLRPRLGATIRQVPREPSYGHLSEILRLLHPYFPMLNLQTADPDFRIDCIPAEQVRCVTLCLSGSDERMRQQSIRRFLGKQTPYQVNRVWQGVAGVRTPAELELCRSMQPRLISGPAVTDLLRAPLGEMNVRFADLPYGAGRKKVVRRLEPEGPQPAAG